MYTWRGTIDRLDISGDGKRALVRDYKTGRPPRSDIRLFGKPEAFTRRRMGVAVANGADVDEARTRAKLAAGKVRPVQG